MTLKSSLLSIAIAAAICCSLTAFATVSLGIEVSADAMAVMISAIH